MPPARHRAASTASSSSSSSPAAAAAAANGEMTYSCIFDGCTHKFLRNAALLQHVHQYHFKEETTVRQESLVPAPNFPHPRPHSAAAASSPSTAHHRASSTAAAAAAAAAASSPGQHPHSAPATPKAHGNAKHKQMAHHQHQHQQRPASAPPTKRKYTLKRRHSMSPTSDSEERGGSSPAASFAAAFKRPRVEDMVAEQAEADAELFAVASSVMENATRAGVRDNRGPAVQLTSEVVASRERVVTGVTADGHPTESRVQEVLVHWYPEDLRDDEWYAVDDVPRTVVVPVHAVPKMRMWDILHARPRRRRMPGQPSTIRKLVKPTPPAETSNANGDATKAPAATGSENGLLPGITSGISAASMRPFVADKHTTINKLSVMLGRDQLAALKTMYLRQHLTHERKFAIKSILFNEPGSPLYGPLISALDRCRTTRFYHGCADDLEELFWTRDLAISHDMLQLLFADPKSPVVRDDKFPLNLHVVQSRLEKREYRELREFVADVNKTFDDISKRLPSRDVNHQAHCSELKEKFNEIVELVCN